MKRKKISISIFFIGLFFLLFSGRVFAIEYGMLGGKPANPDPDVENSNSWFIYNLDAGERKDDAVKIMNLFDQDLRVLIYAADTTKSSSGGFALEQFSEPKGEVGSWVKFYPDVLPQNFKKLFDIKEGKISVLCQMTRDDLKSEQEKNDKGPAISEENFQELEKWCQGKEDIELSLKAKQQLEIPFVFSVPENADVGEHTGGILIQKVTPDDAGNTGASAVKITTRIGVRIYETVPGEIARRLSLADFRVIKNFKEFSFSDWFGDPKTPQEFLIQSTVKNEGNVSVEQENTIHITNLLFGKNVGDISRKFQVLKNDLFISNYSWNNPRFGRFSIYTEIKYKDASGEEKRVVSETVNLWIMPWREMTILAILVLFFGSAIWWWRRRQKKLYGGVGWIKYVVKEGDSLNKLANDLKTDWKILAKTNKLDAPFILEVGMPIIIPPNGDALFASEEGSGGTLAGKETAVNSEVATEDAKKQTEQAASFYGRMFALKNKRIWLAVFFLVFAAISGIIAFKVINLNGGRRVVEIKNELDVPAVGAVEDSPEKTISVSEEDTDAGKIKIWVMNGGAAAGSAGKIRDFLIAKGYSSAEAKNTEQRDKIGTTIYYSEEKNKKEAQWISDMLSGNKISNGIKLAETEEQRSADVVIIMGK